MTIIRISQLFVANSDPTQVVAPSRAVISEPAEPSDSSVDNSDAAVLSHNLSALKSSQLLAANSDHARRIAQIKREIDSKSYHRDSRNIAIAVLRDLG